MIRRILATTATAAVLSFGAVTAASAAPPLPDGAGTLTADFGTRYGVNPLLPADFPEFHNGIDIAAPLGTEIKALSPGVVKFADWAGYGGLRTEILHDDGSVSTYSHQNDIFINVGDRIAVDDIIGTVGTTGNSTGPHLHLEVWYNTVEVDPSPYL